MQKKYDNATSAGAAFCALRPRTVAETREKLVALGFSDSEINEALNELHDALLLNDTEYANEYVSTYLAAKPTSKRALREKLKKHKIDDEIAVEALLVIDDDIELKNACVEAENFVFANRLKMQSAERQKCRERLLRRLISHGYSFQTAKTAVNHVFDECLDEF